MLHGEIEAERLDGVPLLLPPGSCFHTLLGSSAIGQPPLHKATPVVSARAATAPCVLLCLSVSNLEAEARAAAEKAAAEARAAAEANAAAGRAAAAAAAAMVAAEAARERAEQDAMSAAERARREQRRQIQSARQQVHAARRTWHVACASSRVH